MNNNSNASAPSKAFTVTSTLTIAQTQQQMLSALDPLQRTLPPALAQLSPAELLALPLHHAQHAVDIAEHAVVEYPPHAMTVVCPLLCQSICSNILSVSCVMAYYLL